jgi:hypothetical protein
LILSGRFAFVDRPVRKEVKGVDESKVLIKVLNSKNVSGINVRKSVQQCMVAQKQEEIEKDSKMK